MRFYGIVANLITCKSIGNYIILCIKSCKICHNIIVPYNPDNSNSFENVNEALPPRQGKDFL
jgi:hypothetical protein